MEREIVQKMMDMPLEPGTVREMLEAMGLPATYRNGMWLQLVRKAAGGDLSAAKYVRESMGVEETAPLGEDALRALPTAVLREMAKRHKSGE